LLGATGEGDIGQLYPDDDMLLKDADSRVLLRETYHFLKAKGWALINVDATVIAQTPKLMPWKVKICQSIAETLGVQLEQVNVKAKTNERLGYLGREEAVEVRAVVLMQKIW